MKARGRAPGGEGHTWNDVPTGGALATGPTKMTELPLWMTTAPHSGPRTSRDAAADIRPHVATLRARVLAYIASRGADGATAEEVEIGTGLKGNTVRPRLVELRETKCITETGETRRTLSGRKAVVWRLA